jgi:hypothetical protein
LVIIDSSGLIDAGTLKLISRNTANAAGNIAALIRTVSQLTGNSSINGQVVTNDGIPLSDVTVKLLIQDINTNTKIDTEETKKTTSSGEFVFSGIGTGNFILLVEATDYFSETSKIVKVDQAGAKDAGKIYVSAKSPDQAQNTSTIKGVLISNNNNPVGNVAVKLLFQDAATQAIIDTNKSFTTLSSGEFLFGNLNKGNYILKTEADENYFEASKFVIVEASGLIDSGDFVVTTKSPDLPKGTSTITGMIVTNNNSPIGGLEIILRFQDPLSGILSEPVARMTSLTSGEFNFSNLKIGTYILEVEENTNFNQSSKLAIVQDDGVFDSGNMIVFAKEPGLTVPTLDLKAVAKDPLSKSPLSVAQVSLDSGQSTVTNAFGQFELKNIASGSRKLTIIQPGTASFSVNFDVRGTSAPTADGMFINNLLYPVDAAGLVDLEALGVDLTVSPNLHKAGSLIGTVKKFELNNLGYPTSTQTAYSNYEFDLWIINLETGIVRKSHTVVSNPDGTWRLDNLPPFEDNGFLWFAVPVNTSVTVQQGQTGNVAVFENPSPIWAGKDAVLAFGYMVAAGETTVMDFTVPSFVYANISSSINAISDATFSVNGGAAIVDAQAFMTDDLNFAFTGPGTSSEVILEFTRLYKNPEIPTIIKSFKITDTASDAIHSFEFKPSTIGLDYGRFSWRTIAIDPNVESGQAISDSHLMTVRPSATELSPSTGDTVKILNATYTVTFAAPSDPEATDAVMRLYYVDPVSGDDQEIGHADVPEITEKAVFHLTWGKSSPLAGNYKWKVTYFYSDGPPMESETVEFKFVN